MRAGSEIRRTAKETARPNIKKIVLIGFIFLAIGELLKLIPKVGDFLNSLLTGIFGVGTIASIVYLYKGKSDEGVFDFFKRGIEFFTKTFCAGLWLLLKLLPSILIMTVGSIMMILGISGVSTDAINAYLKTYNTVYLNGANFGPVSIIGILLLVIGVILMIWISLKYSLFSYELINNNAPNKRSRDILNDAKELLRGNIGRYVCLLIPITLLWAIIIVVVAIVVGIIMGIVAGILGFREVSKIVSTIVTIIFVYPFVGYMYSRTITATQQFYDELVAEKRGGYNPNPNPNGGYAPNPNAGYNPNPNGGYAPNPNGGYNPNPNGGYNPNPNNGYNPNNGGYNG